LVIYNFSRFRAEIPGTVLASGDSTIKSQITNSGRDRRPTRSVMQDAEKQRRRTKHGPPKPVRRSPVPGVLVGQTTRVRDDSIRTGVSAILPNGGNLFREKVPVPCSSSTGLAS
jgi:hypothetical protein